MENIQGISLLDYKLLPFLKKEFAKICNESEEIINNKELMDDYDFVIEFVKHNPNRICRLMFVSERLRDTKEVVMTAVKNHDYALQYASERLRDKETIVMAAINYNPWALEFASQRLRDCEAIVFAAFRQNSFTFEHYASDRIKKKLKNSFRRTNTN